MQILSPIIIFFATAVVAAKPPCVLPATITGYYNLQTRVLSGDKSKDNLYVGEFHTGAGLSDAVLSTAPQKGLQGFYNATDETQLFWFGNHDFHWNMAIGGYPAYAKW